jgi:glycosyltransferase involved in cell wall biosynthesis
MNQPTVLQVSAWYPPYQIGGTETYVEGLVKELAALGIESTLLVARGAGNPEHYEHAGTLVETYFVNEQPEVDELRKDKPHRDFESFRKRLAAHCGRIYHQHSWTRGCGAHHLRAAREQGFRTVLTVHVASNFCLRGTMLRFGEVSCDGRVEARGCGACWAQSRGLPKAIAESISALPLGLAARAREGRGRIATALSARALGDNKLHQLREMIDNCDRIVAVCAWVRDALVANGAPPDKLLVSRQGIAMDYLKNVKGLGRRRQDPASTLNLLYLGSWNPGKGIDVVVRAMQLLPADLRVHLTVRTLRGGPEHQVYEAGVRALAGNDPRVSFDGPVSRESVAAVMSAHDAIVVPSVLLETGPLVVLEAQAASIFVLGSRLGGIAELVDENDGGELVEAGDVAAWAEAIVSLVRKHAEGRLPAPTRAVRTISAAAADMAALYRSL